MGLLNFEPLEFSYINRNLDYIPKESVYRLYFQTLIIMSDNMNSYRTILDFIERHVTEDDGWDVFSKVASEMVSVFENVEMKAMLLALIKSHRKGDDDESEIVL